MKLRHTAALALVGFWLIMRPPYSGHRLNLDAPLRQWRLSGHIFDSDSACEEARQQLIQNLGVRTPHFEEELQQTLKKPIPHQDIENLKVGLEHAVCVSSNDPRLAK